MAVAFFDYFNFHVVYVLFTQGLDKYVRLRSSKPYGLRYAFCLKKTPSFFANTACRVSSLIALSPSCTLVLFSF